MTRVLNRVLVLVIGLVLAGAGALVIIEGIWTWTNSGFVWIPGEDWLRAFRTTPWSDPANIAISIGVAAVGLILLAFELWPRRPRTAPFRTDNKGDWLLLRRSTEGHVARRVAAEVPIPLTARLKPSLTRWKLKIRARAAASTRGELERSARTQLRRLHAPESSQVRVQTTGASSKSS